MSISWFAFIIATLGGIIAFFEDLRARSVGFILVLVGAGLGLVLAYQDRAEKNSLNLQIVGTKEYAVVATYGPWGDVMRFGPGLTGGNALYKKLQPTYYFDEQEAFHFKCDAGSREIMSDVTQKYPYFPFSYYALATCQKQNEDSSWRMNAEEAKRILDITTQIGGHNETHDVVKVKVIELLSE